MLKIEGLRKVEKGWRFDIAVKEPDGLEMVVMGFRWDGKRVWSPASHTKKGWFPIVKLGATLDAQLAEAVQAMVTSG